MEVNLKPKSKRGGVVYLVLCCEPSYYHLEKNQPLAERNVLRVIKQKVEININLGSLLKIPSS